MKLAHFVRLSSILLLGLWLGLASAFAAQFSRQDVPEQLYYWIDAEQNRIDRSVGNRIKAPDIAAQKPEYRPENGNWFDIRTVWVPEEELNVADTDEMFAFRNSDEFIKEEGGKKYFRLFIHPESENFYQEILAKYPSEISHEATSTASSRTVLMRNKASKDKLYFVKLSLDVELGGVVRTVPASEVARSVGFSKYISQLDLKSKESYIILREPLAIVPKGMRRGGQIIREIPEEILKGEKTLVPIFSLYSTNQGETLLEKYSKELKISPLEFVEKNLLEPFMRGYADMIVNQSISMEPHAQNFLMELDRDKKPTGRLVYRDLGGFNIDFETTAIRDDLKTKMPVFMSYANDYHQERAVDDVTKSIYVYFENGVLTNIDKLLRKIDPKYKADSIYEISRKIMLEQILASSQLDPNIFRKKFLKNPIAIDSDQKLLEVVNEARRSVGNMPKSVAKAAPADCKKVPSLFGRLFKNLSGAHR
ncbi:MAG: hypothetical protein M9962_03155 [Oligoflexia bacterium]|nr:hypothetical protein [Oligoflexia bacterium]